MVGETQPINLGGGRCMNKVTVVHEIGHAVGFYHEHNRPDRDDYIDIHTENIADQGLRAFSKLPSYLVNLYGVPYDYTSIMHYTSDAFSYNGKPTITAKDPNQTIRPGIVLSTLDIKLANLMYGCAGQ